MTVRFDAIVATDLNGAIGVKNTIPWRCPEDLKRFKKITLGCPVIMGRNTYDSIGKALPGRLNIVLSRVGADIPDASVVSTPAQAMELAKDHIARNERCWEREQAFIIGGGEIYAAFLPFYDGLHLTTVNTAIWGADTFFPVDAFLERYAKTGWLRLQQGGEKVIQDGEYKTTYAHYGIIPPNEASRPDLAHTQDHLPWCRTSAALGTVTAEEDEP